jgi:hypothetical protein
MAPKTRRLERETLTSRRSKFGTLSSSSRTGKIREDGRMVHEMYLYEVKSRPNRKGNGFVTSLSPRFRRTSHSSCYRNPDARW